VTDAYGVLRWARDAASRHALTPAQAHVLLVLATYADHKTAETFVRVEVLMADTRRRRSVVAAAIRHLTGLGLLERERRGPGRAALTRLLMSDSPDIKTSGPPDITAPDLRPTGHQDVRSAGHKTSGPPDISIEQPHEPPLGTNLPNPPQAEGDQLPARPVGNRTRDHERDQQALTALAADWFPSGNQTLAVQVINGARGMGKTTRAEVTAYAEEWYPQLLTQDRQAA
jgi:hypothetical protein